MYHLKKKKTFLFCIGDTTFPSPCRGRFSDCIQRRRPEELPSGAGNSLVADGFLFRAKALSNFILKFGLVLECIPEAIQVIT